MESKENLSILVSIFKRKGGEGLFTKIIIETNKFIYREQTKYLGKDEKGLIIHFKDNLNWVLLTNKRLLITKDGNNYSIFFSNIVSVDIALQEEYNDGIIDKKKFTRLQVKDSNDNKYILNIEQGDPYAGFFQVLHFITINKKVFY